MSQQFTLGTVIAIIYGSMIFMVLGSTAAIGLNIYNQVQHGQFEQSARTLLN